MPQHLSSLQGCLFGPAKAVGQPILHSVVRARELHTVGSNGAGGIHGKVYSASLKKGMVVGRESRMQAQVRGQTDLSEHTLGALQHHQPQQQRARRCGSHGRAVFPPHAAVVARLLPRKRSHPCVLQGSSCSCKGGQGRAEDDGGKREGERAGGGSRGGGGGGGGGLLGGGGGAGGGRGGGAGGRGGWYCLLYLLTP
eukprot:SAG31_NODE_2035_length_6610_cov_9.308555_1_plen_196_part_10